MKKQYLEISASAAILLCLLYFLALPGEFMAVFIAVAVHELGHIAMLWILGLKIKSFKADMRGFCISYYGYTSAAGHCLAAAAGPAAGLIYAYAASQLAHKLDSAIFCLSSGTSLILSAFNLIPAMPLDGGRIFAKLSLAVLGEVRGASLSSAVSLLSAILLFALGLYLMIKNMGAAVLIASIWLLFYQESGLGIVKSQEVL